MLNYFITILALNVSILVCLFSIRVEHVKAIFEGINIGLIKPAIVEKPFILPYFDKEILMNNVKEYISLNLENNEYELKFYFKEEYNDQISNYPNMVQIEIKVNILLEYQFVDNVRYKFDGREVTEDWFATF